MVIIKGVFRNFFRKNKSIEESEIAMVKPKNLNEAQAIVDYLNDKIAVVVSFEETEEDKIKQILDFIHGKTYGFQNKVEQIGQKVFLFVPENVEIENTEKK